MKAQGYDVSLKIADMGKVADIERACAEIARECPQVDILINNAGTVLDDDNSRIGVLDIDMLKKTMDVNFIGPVVMCKKLLPLLLKAGHARVINISSSAGGLSADRKVYYPAYSMSKTALNGLTKVLAYENPGVMVFAVDPGWTRTELGGTEATYSVDEGIDTAIYLATADPEKLRTGSFYFLRQVVSW